MVLECESKDIDWKEFIVLVEEESRFTNFPEKIGNTKQLRNYIERLGGIKNATENIKSGEWKFGRIKSTWYIL